MTGASQHMPAHMRTDSICSRPQYSTHFYCTTWWSCSIGPCVRDSLDVCSSVLPWLGTAAACSEAFTTERSIRSVRSGLAVPDHPRCSGARACHVSAVCCGFAVALLRSVLTVTWELAGEQVEVPFA